MLHLHRILDRAPAGRLMSVDLLRGLAIAAMVVVNNPGSWSHIYAPLAHASWHGWTPTDIIFPLFLYVVGLSIVLANGQSPRFPPVGAEHWSRAAKLFGLGLFLALFYYPPFNPDFSWWDDQLANIRVLGVLQRIALVYITCIYLVRVCSMTGLVLVTLALMWLPFCAQIWIPYGSDQGIVYQGELSFGNSLSAWLDQWLLGRDHLYYRDAKPFGFDPEGLLTTLPAMASCLLGVLAGIAWRESDKTPLGRTRLAQRWALAGAALLAAGQLMQPYVPINKALWTPSFVLVSSGISQLLLALLFYLSDVKNIRKPFAPLLVFGVNAIALFMLAGIVGRLLVMIPVADTTLKSYLFTTVFQPLFGDQLGSLAFSLACLLIFYRILWTLYSRRIFWKV